MIRLVTPNRVGRMAITPHSCSCYCCGNLRRHFGTKTIQERQSSIDLIEGLDAEMSGLLHEIMDEYDEVFRTLAKR